MSKSLHSSASNGTKSWCHMNTKIVLIYCWTIRTTIDVFYLHFDIQFEPGVGLAFGWACGSLKATVAAGLRFKVDLSILVLEYFLSEELILLKKAQIESLAKNSIKQTTKDQIKPRAWNKSAHQAINNTIKSTDKIEAKPSIMSTKACILFAVACLLLIVQASSAWEPKLCKDTEGKLVSLDIENCRDRTGDYCELVKGDGFSYDMSFKAGMLMDEKPVSRVRPSW